MQIEAIYDQGRLEFTSPVKLKKGPIRVRVDIPDEDVEQHEDKLPEYDPSDFPKDVQHEVKRLRDIRKQAMDSSTQPQDPPAAMTEKQKERWEAFELRNADRRKQGRPV